MKREHACMLICKFIQYYGNIWSTYSHSSLNVMLFYIVDLHRKQLRTYFRYAQVFQISFDFELYRIFLDYILMHVCIFLYLFPLQMQNLPFKRAN